MVLSVFFVFFLIPETKGIPLESMDQLFETKPIWRAHQRVLEMLDQEHEEHTAERQKELGEVRVEESNESGNVTKSVLDV